eukprot:CAMPEP_0195289168 /NCGR_PEP_ID=MMETSP0707-20130614/5557_1 /TAXON_ID=33640 /ORGANISM="Asterionellopsis glacialis, Strain CCMP134" /LENGTH=506 /DNA_ID=CAMNT_0040349141 /DNA_START=166 /DNA_END=1686 /DNA_ORIENTATION=+
MTPHYAYSLNTALEWFDLDRHTFDNDEQEKENNHDSTRTFPNNSSSSIQWIDPAVLATTLTPPPPPPLHSDVEEEEDQEDIIIVKMPIYPLGACYLPYPDTIHTLHNVEPRNIQMALDLTTVTEESPHKKKDDSTSSPFPFRQQQQQWKDSKFCVVLRAADTGRIASVGTVMNIVSIEPQYDPHRRRRMEEDSSSSSSSEEKDNHNHNNIQDIIRIIVKCRAEPELVDIIHIENPNASSRQSRLVRSPEYLVAHCRSRRSQRQSRKDDDHDDANANANVHPDDTHRQTTEKQLMSQLIDDYMEVRSLYLQGHGSHDLPPFAQEQLRTHLPELTMTTTTTTTTTTKNDDYEDTNTKFWEIAQIWQTLCYTIREGKQINLSSDVNEIMIDAAMRLGGPLKLPVHVEDLPPEARYQVSEMERLAQAEFLALRLDPCLDFQRLLSTPPLLPRLEMLSTMIQRERQRLVKHNASSSSSHDPKNNQKKKKKKKSNNTFQEQPRKGAWFEGFE